jgi:hypothetical protein
MPSLEQRNDFVETVCIGPNAAIAKDEFALTQMMRSHNWTVEAGKPYSNGVIVRYKCSNCGASGHSIILPSENTE